ncbi:MAG: copper resistance protein CopC/CopD [Actinobacteria bacterium]|nr:copper resistance protein CopC/CopD [Actinomycetota bacterium]
MRRALLLGLLVALAWPAGALAHARLKAEHPQFRERFEAAPARVVLRFDQAVDALANSIVVYDTRGKIVSRPARNGADPRTVLAPLQRVPRGAYTVRWHALSSDSHVVSGVYTFGVRMNAPPPTEAYGASGPTRSEDVVRWLYFAALALLVGGLGFRLLVLPRSIPEALERRFYIVTGIGAVGIIHVGIAAFIMRSEDALQLPFGRLLYGDLSPVATGTRFGQAFIAMTLGFTWVLALLFLAWLTGRRALLWPTLLLALVFASGLSLSGHSAVDSSWFTQLADWAHLSAAVLWVGGLVQLAVCVWPAAPGLRREAFLRFARLAPVLIAVLVAAGVYLSILRLPRLSDLWTAGYGQVLLVKLGLVSAALAWGAFHHLFVRPRLERTGWARRSLVGEGAVAMTILLLAAILVNAKPPDQAARRTSLVSNVSSSPSNPP